MPNQLAQSKKRISVAEQKSVLAALETIAEAENLTVTELLRQAARSIIAERALNPRYKAALRKVVANYAPIMPTAFRSPSKVAKFKREQREYDQLLQELNLSNAEYLQRHNSLVETPGGVRLTELTG